MKGKISVWYLILIALGIITMATLMLIAENMLENIFLDALEIAFE